MLSKFLFFLDSVSLSDYCKQKKPWTDVLEIVNLKLESYRRLGNDALSKAGKWLFCSLTLCFVPPDNLSSGHRSDAGPALRLRRNNAGDTTEILNPAEIPAETGFPPRTPGRLA